MFDCYLVPLPRHASTLPLNTVTPLAVDEWGLCPCVLGRRCLNKAHTASIPCPTPSPRVPLTGVPRQKSDSAQLQHLSAADGGQWLGQSVHIKVPTDIYMEEMTVEFDVLRPDGEP